MFRPKQLSRTIIVGSKQYIEKTIELLHGLEIAHIVDYTKSEKESEFKIGSPTEKAVDTNKKLLKIRSNAKLLKIDEESTGKIKTSVENITQNFDSKIFEIEQETKLISEKKTIIEEQLTKTEDIIAQLLPFEKMDIPLEYYQGYKNLTVFTGYIQDIKKLEKNLAEINENYELFYSIHDKTLIALFVYKKYTDTVLKILTECNYYEVKPPQIKGIPKNLIKEYANNRLKLLEKIEKLNNDLVNLKKKYTEFILTNEEYLSIEIQKAEAPLRFATTTHSFIIDCWIPRNEFKKAKNILDKETKGSLYIEEIESKPEDEPPILLDNPKPVKPFEYLVNLYSTPNYKEIDPSFILSLIFPLFLGFMIGDLGYGILLIIFGYIFIKKFKDNEGLYNIGCYIIIGGLFASIFGLFLFGDMFGLSFQSPLHESGQTIYSWSSLLSINIPIPSLIHKTATSGVTQLLLISIIAGYIHLTLGIILGFFNDKKYNKKHAIGKIGLFFILTALVILIFNFADWTVSHWLQPLKNSNISSFLWPYVITPLKTGISFSGILLPYATIILSIIGAIIIFITIGGIGFIEILEVTSHLISYTRLAAIGVAKGALAYAFNIIGLGLILSGNIIIGIIGIIILVILQLIVFVLGSLTSGIQALRLHYVEFFMKFYKGGGVKFEPFKYIRKYTTTK